MTIATAEGKFARLENLQGIYGRVTISGLNKNLTVITGINEAKQAVDDVNAAHEVACLKREGIVRKHGIISAKTYAKSKVRDALEKVGKLVESDLRDAAEKFLKAVRATHPTPFEDWADEANKLEDILAKGYKP